MSTGVVSNLIYLSGYCGTNCVFGNVELTAANSPNNITFIAAYSTNLTVIWAKGISIPTTESLIKIMASEVTNNIYLLSHSLDKMQSNIYTINENLRINWNISQIFKNACNFNSADVCSTFTINPSVESRIIVIQNTIPYSIHLMDVEVGKNSAICKKCPAGTYSGIKTIQLIIN